MFAVWYFSPAYQECETPTTCVSMAPPLLHLLRSTQTQVVLLATLVTLVLEVPIDASLRISGILDLEMRGRRGRINDDKNMFSFSANLSLFMPFLKTMIQFSKKMLEMA